MGLRDRMNQILSGGAVDDESEAPPSALRARMDSILGGQPQVGVTLEGLDAEAAARGDKIPEWKDPRSNWDKPWDEALGAVAPGALDAVRGVAAGVLTGTGTNVDTPESRQSAQRSPWLYGGGKLGSEVGAQAALIPQRAGGVAMGALGGLLSGYGNTQGSTTERLQGAGEGALIGAGAGRAGELVGDAAGGLSSLLKRKAGEYGYEQASQGLIKLGADAGDLKYLDDIGGADGRQRFYDDGKRLGINGRPKAAVGQAQAANDAASAQRQAILAQSPDGPPQIDPAALRARVAGANPYPGVEALDSAAGKAADQVAAQAPDFQAVDRMRGYWGKKANFASGTPENTLRQNIHGGISDELDEALTLQNPGSGDAWRAAGRDQQSAIELGEIAQSAADKARVGRSGQDTLFGTLKRGVYDEYAPGMKERAYGAASNLSSLGSAVAGGARQLPNAGGAIGGELAPQPVQLDQSVLDLLHSPSQGSELGQYRAKFAAAMGQRGQGNVQQLLSELIQTDANFRTQILPLLRGGAR